MLEATSILYVLLKKSGCGQLLPVSIIFTFQIHLENTSEFETLPRMFGPKSWHVT